jgi:hypothetical protein
MQLLDPTCFQSLRALEQDVPLHIPPPRATQMSLGAALNVKLQPISHGLWTVQPPNRVQHVGGPSGSIFRQFLSTAFPLKPS